MSELIERHEHRHLNVKSQDEWRVKEDGKGPEYATIVLATNPYQGNGTAGRLYINGIRLEMLRAVGDAIDSFLETQTKRLQTLKEAAEQVTPTEE